MAENAEKLVVFCRFQSNEFQCTKHHKHKPDMKQHEKHHKIRSKPNMKPQTQRETTASWSFISLALLLGVHNVTPTRNTHDMKQRHLWGDFQLQQLSRLRARDVLARCRNYVVSCGVWFHRGFVVLWPSFKYYIVLLQLPVLRGSRENHRNQENHFLKTTPWSKPRPFGAPNFQKFGERPIKASSGKRPIPWRRQQCFTNRVLAETICEASKTPF